MRFIQFGCIRGCLVALRNSVRNGPKLVQKFVPRSRVGIFHNERTRSSPLDSKMTFWCVSYYLGAFGTVCLPYETRCKMGRTIQKFVPRSRVRIFCNEHTRSTPLDPKLMFWCVSYYLSAFGIIWLPYKTLRKTGGSFLHKFVPRSRVRSFAMNISDPPHWTLN